MCCSPGVTAPAAAKARVYSTKAMPSACGPIRAGSRKVRLSENRNTTQSDQIASLRWWSRSNKSGEKNCRIHPAWGIMAIRAQKETEAPIWPR